MTEASALQRCLKQSMCINSAEHLYVYEGHYKSIKYKLTWTVISTACA